MHLPTSVPLISTELFSSHSFSCRAAPRPPRRAQQLRRAAAVQRGGRAGASRGAHHVVCLVEEEDRVLPAAVRGGRVRSAHAIARQRAVPPEYGDTRVTYHWMLNSFACSGSVTYVYGMNTMPALWGGAAQRVRQVARVQPRREAAGAARGSARRGLRAVRRFLER